jgi:hypothetical protein
MIKEIDKKTTVKASFSDTIKGLQYFSNTKIYKISTTSQRLPYYLLLLLVSQWNHSKS